MGEQVEVKLEGAMTIAKAEGLHHELEKIFQKASPVCFHAAEASRVDTSIIQLLYSFVSSMNSAGVDVTWDGVSDELKAGAKLLGLDAHLSF